MLSKLVKEHQKRKTILKDENEKLKKAASDSVNQTTEKMMDSINSDVAFIFSNQKRLEIEGKKLQQETGKFAKQTTQWITLVESFNNSLKELGDIENWAQMIENDMKAISLTLEEIHKAEAHINKS